MTGGVPAGAASPGPGSERAGGGLAFVRFPSGALARGSIPGGIPDAEITVVGIADDAASRRPERCRTLEELRSRGVRVVSVFHREHAPRVLDALPSLWRTLRHGRGALLLHPERKPPPTVWERNDGPVRALSCHADVLFDFVERKGCEALGNFCFEIGAFALSAAGRVLRIEACELPLLPPLARPAPAPTAPVAMIIPHRGDLEHLRCCLHFVGNLAERPAAVRVCFDEELSPGHAALVAAFPWAEFFRTVPASVGPYVARHLLGEGAGEGFVAFQDSDDVPLSGRIPEQLVELDGCDMVGCHELCLDEIERTVTAFRFPLDVSAALSREPAYALFHPTSLVRTEAFRRAGGLSTARAFGSDFEFLLRAHFSMRIRNVDRFLYLRRRRAGSLTTAPETALGSPARTALEAAWERDFVRVTAGTLPLRESALWPAHLAPRPTLQRVGPSALP
jgi:hypothetical protein